MADGGNAAEHFPAVFESMTREWFKLGKGDKLFGDTLTIDQEICLIRALMEAKTSYYHRATRGSSGSERKINRRLYNEAVQVHADLDRIVAERVKARNGLAEGISRRVSDVVDARPESL